MDTNKFDNYLRKTSGRDLYYWIRQKLIKGETTGKKMSQVCLRWLEIHGIQKLGNIDFVPAEDVVNCGLIQNGNDWVVETKEVEIQKTIGSGMNKKIITERTQLPKKYTEYYARNKATDIGKTIIHDPNIIQEIKEVAKEMTD